MFGLQASKHSSKMTKKAIKKQQRLYLGSMLIALVFCAIQTTTLYADFTWLALLNVAVSVAALALFMVGLADLRKCGHKGIRYGFIRRWGLALYIIALAVVNHFTN
jgi:cobalamin synthase